MSTIVILEAEIIESNKYKLIEKLSKYLPETRLYTGFIDIKIHFDEDSGAVMFYEEWERKEHYLSYLNWRTETGVMSELGNLFQSQPRIRFFYNENI